MEKILEIRHLVKNFGDHQVLRDISFGVEKGEVICIIGSSGSGKSTLLRCINFLEQPTKGEILYHGRNGLLTGAEDQPVLQCGGRISGKQPGDPGGKRNSRNHRRDRRKLCTAFL